MASTTLKTDKLVILQLTDDEEEWIQKLFAQIRANEDLIEDLAARNKESRKRAWTAIAERFPESKDKTVSLDHKMKTLTCVD